MRRVSHQLVVFASVAVLIGLLVASMFRIALAQTSVSRGGPPGIALQATTPGVMQSGNANISGSYCAGCSSATTGGILAAAGLATGAVTLVYPGTALTGVNSAFEFSFVGNPAAFNRIANFSYSNHSPVGYVGFGSTTTIARLGLASNSGLSSAEIVTGFGPLSLNGAGNVNNTENVIIDTQGGAQTGGNLLNVRLNGVSKLAVATTGAVTTATPIPQTSGGTGAGALTCAAGSFITSNGTAYSCGTPGAAFVVAANIGSTGTINKQTPAATISSVTKGGTGVYTVNLTGMTATGIATCTPFQGASPGYMCTATAGAGTIAITIVNGANGVADQQFMLIVAAL